MASEKPGSIERGGDELLENLQDFGNSLLAMENMDRSSPEMWPEKVPGVTDFINSYNSTHIPPKMPYSKEMMEEDRIYIQQLASLPASSLIAKVKELHDIAYQLGVEESKEISRGKCLNIFRNSNKDKGEK
ncbi:protein lin-52 homolog [Anthonomus grandis grandis]|uniref:protein lin-52 homolog n=1 Tax=Anthonomus grandis grandis TaxID=2921223 RepID=UPI00216598CA|nr:protein lin-52 homolog [Anthonomus grandis grandis]